MYYKIRHFLYFLKTPLVRLLKPKADYLKSGINAPISPYYGFDRGKPVDRLYIEEFVKGNSNLITGKCLEVQSTDYIDTYGKNVIKADCLDIDKSNTRATIIGDLRNLKNIKSNTYDCFVLNQTINLIDDIDACIKESYRILKPGGSLIVTLPCIQRIDPDAGVVNDYWRVTPASAKFLFKKYFKNVEVQYFGNLKAALAILQGFVLEEVNIEDIAHKDSAYPCVVGIVAKK